MEEYIKVLKGFLKTEVLNGRMALTSPQADILKHAITSLINKYKKQEKIIELMAKEMSEEDENFLYRNTSDIIDYFKKKVKGE